MLSSLWNPPLPPRSLPLPHQRMRSLPLSPLQLLLPLSIPLRLPPPAHLQTLQGQSPYLLSLRSPLRSVYPLLQDPVLPPVMLPVRSVAASSVTTGAIPSSAAVVSPAFLLPSFREDAAACVCMLSGTIWKSIAAAMDSTRRFRLSSLYSAFNSDSFSLPFGTSMGMLQNYFRFVNGS